MLLQDTIAVVCALRGYGEHGGIVRLFTRDHGLIAAFVRGARGRRMRPILIPGNVVAAQLRARNDAQLPQAAIELVRSRAPLLAEPLPAAAIEWTAALIAAALPERQPYPRIYDALSGFLDALEAAPVARDWAVALVRLELLTAAELGYGRALPGLPESIRAGASARWPEVTAGLHISGRMLAAEILAGSPATLAAARERLIRRLKRAAG